MGEKIISANPYEKEVYRITLLGSFANFLLLLLKFFAGIIGNSAAMIADAVHSLSDFVTDIVVIVFVRFSNKPKDEFYDYGYGKYETLATAIIGVILFIIGFGILWGGAGSIHRFYTTGELEQPGMLALVMALASIVVKEILYRITAATGRKVNSHGNRHRWRNLLRRRLAGPRPYRCHHSELLHNESGYTATYSQFRRAA